jgi:hypothetical protein
MATRLDGVRTRSGEEASLVVWRQLEGDAPDGRAQLAAKPPAESYTTQSGRRLGVRVIDTEEGLLALGE